VGGPPLVQDNPVSTTPGTPPAGGQPAEAAPGPEEILESPLRQAAVPAPVPEPAAETSAVLPPQEPEEQPPAPPGVATGEPVAEEAAEATGPAAVMQPEAQPEQPEPAAFPAGQYYPQRPDMLQPGSYPGWGYPLQMPYGYPSWQEGVGYVPPFGYGLPMMSPFGAYGGFPAYGFFPPMPWPGAYPPYGMPYYPPMQPPPAYPGTSVAGAPYQAMPYGQAYPAQKKRMKTVYIVLIIVGVLLLIGGAVTAAVLLTGNSNSSFKLGDGSVTGADIDFRDLVLKQSDSDVTLTGTYDNNTKREGKVYITVQAASKGTEQLLSFTVPVTPGKGHSVNQKKTSTAKISGATLGALIYQGSSSTNNSNSSSDSYPWETTPSNNSTSPYDNSETTPYTTSPYSTPGSRISPSSAY